MDTLARKEKALIDTAVARLGLAEVYEVVLASSLNCTEEYKALLASVEKAVGTSADPYFKYEACDIEFFRLHKKAKVKLSWVIDIKHAPKFDERAFDQFYTELFGKSMAFIYTIPGRTFDKRRPKVSPYVSVPDEKRVLIEGKDWKEILGTWKDSNKEAFEHLEKITTEFEKLFPSVATDEKTIEAKVARIIECIFLKESFSAVKA